MNKIGVFFGTDTGTTRLIAKKMARIMGDIASKPLNINRTSVDEFLQYNSLILGTPSYGIGDLPGIDTGIKAGSWHEFLPELDGVDLSGKRIALYGLGNQEKYTERFADSLFGLYEKLTELGAKIIGRWPTDGYDFEYSKSVINDKFIGLIIDQNNQAILTDERMQTWLDQVTPVLLEHISVSHQHAV